MSTFVVVDKKTLNEVNVDATNINLKAPSTVHTKLYRDDVKEFIQDGNNLVLKLKNGKIIVINDFFIKKDDEESELIFEDEDCAIPWLPLLLGAAGGVGAAAAIANSNGGSSSSSNNNNDNQNNKLPNVDVTVNPDGSIIVTYPNDVDQNSIKPDEIIVTGPDGQPIPDIKFEGPDADGNYIAKVPDGSTGNITVTVPDGSYNDQSGKPGLSGSGNGFVKVPAVLINGYEDNEGNPAENIGTGGLTNDNKPVISGTAKNATTVDVYVDGKVVGTAVVNPDGTWSLPELSEALSDGSHTITAVAKDADGNVGSSNEYTVTVDTTVNAGKPEMVTDPEGNTTITVKVPTDITNDKIVVTDATGKPIEGLLVAGPDKDGNVTIEGKIPEGVVPELSVTDKAGNTDKVVITDKTPSAVIGGYEDNVGNPAENIGIGGLTNDNKPVISGTAKNATTVDVYVDGKVVGTAVVNPDGTWSLPELSEALSDGSHTITAVAKDADGNVGSSNEYTVTVDTKAPSVDVVINNDGTVDFIFSETVKDFVASDVIVEKGTISNLVKDPESNKWTANLTPNPDFEGDVTVTVQDNSYTDLTGNNGKGNSDIASTPVDTKAPSVEIVINDDGTVDFIFSETVKDFVASDVIVENGTISNLVKDPESNKWTANLAPNPDFEGNVTVTVSEKSYTDLTGNEGTGNTASTLVDTKAPSVEVEIDPINKNLVTFTFTEIPYGVDGKPLTSAELKELIKSDNVNIDFSKLESKDGGLTWTAPIQAQSAGEMKIELVVTEDKSYQDSAKNTGTSGNASVVIVQPPKVEQSTDLQKPDISGEDAYGKPITNGTFDSTHGSKEDGKGDPNYYDKHNLTFTVPDNEDPSTVRGVINLDKLDNSFMIWVNGEKIIDSGVFQIQDNDPTHQGNEVGLVFQDGTWLSSGSPWDENTNGLPRFQIVISDGKISFYATREVNSTQLEQIFFANKADEDRLKEIIFKNGENTITVGNADGTGIDTIKGYLTVTIGGQFVISDEDSAALQSMTVILTGYQQGDELTPVLPEGIKAGQLEFVDGVWQLVFTGVASVEKYQDALNALMFKGNLAGDRSIIIITKDTSGLETEVSSGSMNYKPGDGTIPIGQFDYNNSKVMADLGDDIISTGMMGNDTVIYDLLSKFDGDGKGGHGIDTWSDFGRGNPANNSNADKIQFSTDFFEGLTLQDLTDKDTDVVSKFISVEYNAETDTATISVDRDGAGNKYNSENLLHLTNQDTAITLDELLANNQIVIG